jgi:sulfur carrier protein
VNLVVNGESRELPSGSTVRDLLPDPVGNAVALNGEVVPRAEHQQTALNQGDVVEIVTAVPGG